jgi:hypothetical protein
MLFFRKQQGLVISGAVKDVDDFYRVRADAPISRQTPQTFRPSETMRARTLV